MHKFTGVILKSLPVLRKAAVDRGLRFCPSSMDVERGTTSLNALKMRYFSVYFYIFSSPEPKAPEELLVC